MKVSGQNIFTMKSVNDGKPKMYPETEKLIKVIIKLMKKAGIQKIEI